MIARLEQLLKSLAGLDARTLGHGAIERAQRQRMLACVLDESSYWKYVSESATEQRELIEAVVVPETWFFRYPESFALLTVQARVLQRRRPTGLPLRFLSLPCSSGEEPYSIAMALLDAGFSPGDVHIDALDVSQRVVEQAKQGSYGSNAFRGNDLGFRDRYFQRELDGTHRIHEKLRSIVNFQSGNLLDAAVLPVGAVYDFVFCRNLLIYFDRPTQLQAFARLERWLQADGLFFVGPAECGLLSQRGLQALDTAHSFAFRRHTTPQSPRPPLYPIAAKPALPWAPALLATRPPPSSGANEKAAPRVSPDRGATAGLAQIAALANAGRSAEALNACVQQSTRHGPSAELFYWWGLLSDGEGQSEAAQGYYRKALYLDPCHAQALAHLSALLAAQGNRSGAARLQQRLKQRESHDDAKH